MFVASLTSNCSVKIDSQVVSAHFLGCLFVNTRVVVDLCGPRAVSKWVSVYVSK